MPEWQVAGSYLKNREITGVPIKSMTAFATASGQSDHLSWRWDLRSVNARGLDLRMRVPAGCEALEMPARTAAQKRLSRGSVSIQFSYVLQSDGGESSVDAEAVARHVETLIAVRDACEARGIAVRPVTGEILAAAPALQGAQAQDLHALIDSVSQQASEDFGTALDALVTARDAEGAHLESVISGHLTRIESLIQEASGCAGEAVRALREKLARQVKSLISGENALSEERLEQEVALLAIKADVREELDRLTAHCAAARELLAGTGPVGRRLDFLTQEFNREANTLCAKAASGPMTRIGLDLKTIIDQMREQAANVE